MKTSLKVEGMSCQNCVRHVREALTSVVGVASVEIDLKSAEATVVWGAGAHAPSLLAALIKAGYPGSLLE